MRQRNYANADRVTLGRALDAHFTCIAPEKPEGDAWYDDQGDLQIGDLDDIVRTCAACGDPVSRCHAALFNGFCSAKCELEIP